MNKNLHLPTHSVLLWSSFPFKVLVLRLGTVLILIGGGGGGAFVESLSDGLLAQLVRSGIDFFFFSPFLGCRDCES